MNKSSRFVPTIRLEQYDVINKKNEDMGQIQTFVVDMNEGLIAFALVAFGGTLGISDKWFALPWEALKWRPEDMKFVLDMPAEVLQEAPGMDKDHWLEEIEKWQKDEDMADIDRYYTRHGYRSYLGVVQSVNVKRARRVVDAKFEINKDVAGEFRFKLIATNGEVIAVSEGYNAKAGVLNGIESVRNNAPDALIDDKTG
ncbi:DUF1508 domain-containing protein [Dehalogenimonas sp. THU2]|uniref:DUF1508 domain-containing protein n=1 Tax=Dehalogenimonas sp. THU2 TaxID=3151121 RepID=UPI00321865E5